MADKIWKPVADKIWIPVADKIWKPVADKIWKRVADKIWKPVADKTVVTSAFWGKEQNTNVTISVLQPESKSVLGIDRPLADQKIVRYRYTERRQDRCR